VPLNRYPAASRRTLRSSTRYHSSFVGTAWSRARGRAAIAAIAASADEAVVPLLIEAVRDPELAVSAAAARGLLERDLERHRRLVEPVVAAWRTSEFPPFDVHEVHRLLEGE